MVNALKMATAGLGPACRVVVSGKFHFRSGVFICDRKARRRSYTVSGSLTVPPVTMLDPVSIPVSTSNSQHSSIRERVDGPEWKKLSSVELGITNSKLSKSVKYVLNGLKKRGYQAYLVGGCVRDLILKRTPKDFDIITTANLYEVKKTFPHCRIVGWRFPICHVHVGDTIIEVSSFYTAAKNTSMDPTSFFKKPTECDDEQDYMRWNNCLRRDFTINGLMFDPYAKIVYDYAGGFEDIKKAKVRTVINAYASFEEDCARILRAIRIAARLNFRFTRDTSQSIKKFSYKLLGLDKSRLQMEMNYMLGYGSAEASLRLMWKVGILELLLPIQAAYFVSQGFLRHDKGSNMLLCLFSNLDRLLAPDRPCHCSLWTSLLAFHHALSKTPRDPLVLATFSLAMHYGGKIGEAVAIAKGITHQYDNSFMELTKPGNWESDSKLISEVMDLAASVNSSLSLMTDERNILKAIARYRQAPQSNLVIISMNIYLKVREIFSCVMKDTTKANFAAKQGSIVNYENLLEGDVAELRHVFARVVFDTIYPPDA